MNNPSPEQDRRSSSDRQVVQAAGSSGRSPVVCPSCSMEASSSDRRLFRPIPGEVHLRCCRNCQAVIDLSTQSPLIAEALASV